MELSQIEKLIEFIINNDTLMSSIIVASIGCLGVFITARYSVKTALASKEKQHQMDIDLENRKNKFELYQKWYEIMKLTMQGESNKKVETKTLDFFRESMFYASKETISAILDFKVSSITTDNSKFNVLFKVENILFKMRNDLNLSNKGLKKGDLLKVIMSDPREIDEILKSQRIITRLKVYLFNLINTIRKGK